MALAENLIPSNGRHSISEAIVSIFLAQPILKPGRFKEILSRDGFFKEKFQTFKIQHAFTLSGQIRGNDSGIQQSNFSTNEPQENGFLFESYKNGDREYFVQCVNGQNYSVLSIHSFQYERWDNFLINVKEVLKEINNFQSGLFVNSIGVSYIDQFDWLGQKQLLMREVFRSDNEYIPPALINTTDDWSFSFGHRNNVNGDDFIEHINMSYVPKSLNNHLLTLSHNTADDKSIDVLELTQENIEQIIVPRLAVMHNLNKNFLKATLNNSVLEIIGLN